MLGPFSAARRQLMSSEHDPGDAIGRITHYFGHLSVAAIQLEAPIEIGQHIHIKGHTTDLVQTVDSMEVDHQRVERAAPGDDVALHVDDHVREHDTVYREA
jgi:putative protease